MAAGPDLSGAGASGKKKGKGRREAPRVGLGFSSLSSPAVPSSCPRRALALRRSAGINAHQPASRMESRVWHFTGTEGVSWLGLLIGSVAFLSISTGCFRGYWWLVLPERTVRLRCQVKSAVELNYVSYGSTLRTTVLASTWFRQILICSRNRIHTVIQWFVLEYSVLPIRYINLFLYLNSESAYPTRAW